MPLKWAEIILGFLKLISVSQLTNVIVIVKTPICFINMYKYRGYVLKIDNHSMQVISTCVYNENMAKHERKYCL